MEQVEPALKSLSVGDPADPATAMGPLISARHLRRSPPTSTKRRRWPSAAAPRRGLASGSADRAGPGRRDQPAVARGDLRPGDRRHAVRGRGGRHPAGQRHPVRAVRVLWTRDLGRALRVVRAWDSGNLSVNSHSSVRYWTPFGGFEQSGLGRELGPDAVESFTETKNVFIATGE